MLRFFLVLLARTASCHARFFVGWTWFSSTLFVNFSHGSHGFPLDFPRFWGFSQHGFWGFRTVSQHQKNPFGFAALAEIFSDFSAVSDDFPSPVATHQWVGGTQREEIYQHGAPSLYEGRGVVDGAGLGWIAGVLFTKLQFHVSRWSEWRFMNKALW